jgi:hypothetical protein
MLMFAQTIFPTVRYSNSNVIAGLPAHARLGPTVRFRKGQDAAILLEEYLQTVGPVSG